MKAKGICSYSGAYIYKADGRIVATGTESQSLLIQMSYSYRPTPLVIGWCSKGSRNPFLFRGPIPTRPFTKDLTHYRMCRNPFLFRGPIPTLFPLWYRSRIKVTIPSYSEVLFLLYFLYGIDPGLKSQSLLIQRSYSYSATSAPIVVGQEKSRNPFLFRGPIPT